jgi:hypothetical protein
MPLHGTSRAYILDRLRRTEGLSHFADAIESGAISAHEVALSLGWIQPRATGNGSTNAAKRRQHRFALAAGDGERLRQLQELWLGPGPDGSVFDSTEDLCSAWEEHRDECLRLWGQHGRRPMAWWCFDAPGLGLKWPGHDHEQAYLFEAGILSEAERAELLASWRREFDRDHSPAHLNWADVPQSLRQQWQAERVQAKKSPRWQASRAK